MAKVNKEKKDDDKKLKKKTKKDFVEELNSQPLIYECNVCDSKLETFQKLMSHVKIYHQSNNSTQTQTKTVEEKSGQCSKSGLICDKAEQTYDEEILELEFETYPCYYCGFNIENKNHLGHHRLECRGTSKMFGEIGLPGKH